jgi:SAM-dependent methyltransferase
MTIDGKASFWLTAKVRARTFADEAIPEGGDLRVFDVDAALRINDARMRAIESLGLDLENKRVLDVGSGPGHFIGFYQSRRCTVTAVEGRVDNVAALRQRHPDVQAVVADVQSFDLTALGRFDVVHCLGLLYHLENPIAALRNMFNVCAGVLVLETIVMDAAGPVLAIEDEMKTVNQALAGIGCRPTPSFVAMALNRVGFPFVYGLAQPPDHEDFQFEWIGDGRYQRDGHPLRCMFVASSTALRNSGLVPLAE